MNHLTKEEKMAMTPWAYKKNSKLKKKFIQKPKKKSKKKSKNSERKPFPTIFKKTKSRLDVVKPAIKKKDALLPLNEQQQNAFDKISKTKNNIFLTGSAGTGKSYVIKQYLNQSEKEIPVLATTGAAAVLVGGVTFHKFFGLGIADFDDDVVIANAYENDWVRKRILQTSEIIIDEVSMLNPRVFELASEISKKVKNNGLVFGGIRIILTGDFFQLAPVSSDERDKLFPKWVFNSVTWQLLNLTCIELTQTVRTDNADFIRVLNKVRYGICDDEVVSFLNKHTPEKLKENYDGTVLYGTNKGVDDYNKRKLDFIGSKIVKVKTDVVLNNVNFKSDPFKDSPIPEVLHLKEGAIVMIRKNDAENRYVNGTIGRVEKISNEKLHVKTKNNVLVLEKQEFEIKNGDGKVQATLTNFPVVLGWAMTIHKSQGTSLDYLRIDLSNLWGAGQAYVALSRATNPDKLVVEKWSPRSIKTDAEVVEFYEKFSKRKGADDIRS